MGLLIEADEGEHVDALCDAELAAAQVLKQAQEVEKQREGLVAPAIAAERLAEDRWRDAVEYHRRKVAAERAVAGKGTPQEQATALKDVAAAETVVTRERASAEGMRTARVQAEADLEEARAAVAEATQAHDAAYAKLDNPGRTPLSVDTCTLEPRLVLALAGKLRLTEFERMLCAVGVAAMAQASGHDESVRASARADARAEMEKEAAERAVLFPGSSPDQMTVMPPGSRRVPGGVLPGGGRPVPDPRAKPAPVVTPAGPGVVTPGLYVAPGVASQ